jgi:hypothetical protein
LVIPEAEYEKLTGKRPTFKDWLLNGPSFDGLAATALHHGLRLMTRNTSDFEPTGAALTNPWDK